MSSEINNKNTTFQEAAEVKVNTVRQVTQILHDSCPKATASAVALAIVLAFIFKSAVPITNIQLWLAGFFLTYTTRLAVTVSAKRKINACSDPERYLNAYRLLTTLCGLTWGSAGFLLYSQETNYQYFLAISIAGVCAASCSVYVVDKLTNLGFLTAAILPIIPNLLLSDSGISVGIATATIIFGIYSFVVSLNNGKKFIENITLRFEEKHSKETIYSLSERHRSHMEHTPLAVIEWDKQLNITFWNAAAEKMFGFTSEQAIGQSAKLFVAEAHLGLVIEHLTGLIGGHDESKLLTDCQNKSGEVIYCKWFNTVLHDHHGEINGIASLIQDQTDYVKAKKEIEDLAYLDALTHLANRRLLMNRLEHAISKNLRKKTIGSLIFIDIDKFKWLNDNYGHRVGDLLLCEIAARLKKLLRTSDTVARLGGDEFVLMLEEIHSNLEGARNASQIVAEKVLECFQQPFQIEHLQYRCSASLGITIFDEKTSSPDEVIRRADAAMYQSKNGGRNTYHFYDESMQTQIDLRDRLKLDLQTALDTHQFHLHLQPQVSANHGIKGAEVLIRWMHPERGNISPADFIPVAEESGMVVPIGNWVLLEACHLLKKWEALSQAKQLTLSVNVSAMQFSQPNFIDHVNFAIQQSQCNPHQLILELTESAVVHQIDDVIHKMLALKKLGITFSMDDFGVGYSSLSVLKRLPIDELKIDQSFVADLPDNQDSASITRTIIAMGSSLKLKIIAEGIENKAQETFLIQAGCENFQGYFYGKPVSPDEFMTMLPKQSKKTRAKTVDLT